MNVLGAIWSYINMLLFSDFCKHIKPIVAYTLIKIDLVIWFWTKQFYCYSLHYFPMLGISQITEEYWLIPNSIMSKKNDGFDFGIFGIKMTAFPPPIRKNKNILKIRSKDKVF